MDINKIITLKENMNTFIQPVSMLCTKEQYEKDLRQPLLEMGYEERDFTEWNKRPYLVTNYMGFNNKISNTYNTAYESNGRYFIDHYNPELFLALAAMRKTILSSNGKDFSIGKGEWVEHMEYNAQIAINPNGLLSTELWKKMTKDELIKKFTIMKDLRELLTEGRAVIDHSGYIGVVLGKDVRVIKWKRGIISPISRLNENLEMKSQETWKIHKVHEVSTEEFLKFFDGNSNIKLGSLIWSRKKSYTIDQLIEKAGLNKDEIEVITSCTQ